MNVKDTMIRLAKHVREGEFCSCPFIITKDSKIELAIFTYFASSDEPLTVFGFGQLLTTDGNDIVSTELDPFESETDFITINQNPQVEHQEHQLLYDCYYNALQSIIDGFESNKPLETAMLSKAFLDLIPIDGLELYRRICPNYLELLNL